MSSVDGPSLTMCQTRSPRREVRTSPANRPALASDGRLYVCPKNKGQSCFLLRHAVEKGHY